MQVESIRDYKLEYDGVPLRNGPGWLAYLTITAPSTNPMHRLDVFPRQRVASHTIFPTEEAAEQAAREIALCMFETPAR